MLATGLRGHLGALEIEEDDEKFTFTVHDCPSGGRQIAGGAYDRPDGFLRVKKAQPMTFDRPDFPVYCAHCSFQNRVTDGIGDQPLFTAEPAADPGRGPCRMYLYK